MKRVWQFAIVLSVALVVYGVSAREIYLPGPLRVDISTAPEPAVITGDNLYTAAKGYIDKIVTEKGHFPLHDEVTGQDLKLTLVDVHKDKFLRLATDRYAICAEFKAEDGTVYDVDLIFTGATPDSLSFSEMSIHRVGDKERYTWREEGGFWTKVPVEVITPEAPVAPTAPLEEPRGEGYMDD
jgi:hypothetical protein